MLFPSSKEPPPSATWPGMDVCGNWNAGVPLVTEFGKLSRADRVTPALLYESGPRVVMVNRPNPARITVLSLLNGVGKTHARIKIVHWRVPQTLWQAGLAGGNY